MTRTIIITDLTEHLYPCHLRLSIDLDSPLAETLLEPFRQICIETRKDILAILQNGHLTSETTENRRELQADDTTADYAKSARNILYIKDFTGCKYSRKIGARNWQRS